MCSNWKLCVSNKPLARKSRCLCLELSAQKLKSSELHQSAGLVALGRSVGRAANKDSLAASAFRWRCVCAVAAASAAKASESSSSGSRKFPWEKEKDFSTRTHFSACSAHTHTHKLASEESERAHTHRLTDGRTDGRDRRAKKQSAKPGEH